LPPAARVIALATSTDPTSVASVPARYDHSSVLTSTTVS
jgi:hypothetical protein